MSIERERRAHILEVAERLLRHYGPQKTTIAEIARAADVGVGTVYLEFPSKEAIVEELSLERHSIVLDAMRQAIRNGRTPSERLCAVFDARLRAFAMLDAEGAHARDLVHCVSPAVRAAHDRFKQSELSLLSELLRDAVATGDFAIDRPIDEIASALLMAYASLAPPYVFGADSADLERRARALHSVILKGLLARTPSPNKARRCR
jgi:AcrR family transcriptional regulator